MKCYICGRLIINVVRPQEKPTCSRKCWAKKHRELVTGKNGVVASNWKGGEFIAATGYVWVYAPGISITSKKKHMLKHRLVMSQHLKRPLLNSEIVHHKNGLKHDNRIENLEVLSRAQHNAIHNSLKEYNAMRKKAFV
jgi:hypothetical protein